MPPFFKIGLSCTVLIIDIYFVKHTDRLSPARRNSAALKCFYTCAGHSSSCVLYWTREAEVYWSVMTEQVSFQRNHSAC